MDNETKKEKIRAKKKKIIKGIISTLKSKGGLKYMNNKYSFFWTGCFVDMFLPNDNRVL